MAEIQPFQGVLYNRARVNPPDVLTQPYDKITPELRERYLTRSPHNLVRIELGKEQPGDTETDNKYTRASRLYREWLREGILVRSPQPSLYCLEQQFDAPNGSGRLCRRALIARVRLHAWHEGVVLPHEHTLSKPKADRLALLRTCGAQQGQIFMMYPSPARRLHEIAHQDTVPVLTAVDDFGVDNKLWEISDPSAIRAIQQALEPLRFYIADGHHRYETALAFRDESRARLNQGDRDAPHEFVMATLVDMDDPGLVILPTHRTVAHLDGFDRTAFRRALAARFDLQPQPTLAALLSGLRSAGAAHVLGMADGHELVLLRIRDPGAIEQWFSSKPPLWQTLDVAILHVAILEQLLGIHEARLRDEANVGYWREPQLAWDEVRQGRAHLAFFLNPTRVADVRAIADARSRMPQKSTDFYPKLLSGMVMYETR